MKTQLVNAFILIELSVALNWRLGGWHAFYIWCLSADALEQSDGVQVAVVARSSSRNDYGCLGSSSIIQVSIADNHPMSNTSSDAASTATMKPAIPLLTLLVFTS